MFRVIFRDIWLRFHAAQIGQEKCEKLNSYGAEPAQIFPTKTDQLLDALQQMSPSVKIAIIVVNGLPANVENFAIGRRQTRRRTARTWRSTAGAGATWHGEKIDLVIYRSIDEFSRF